MCYHLVPCQVYDSFEIVYIMAFGSSFLLHVTIKIHNCRLFYLLGSDWTLANRVEILMDALSQPHRLVQTRKHMATIRILISLILDLEYELL